MLLKTDHKNFQVSTKTGVKSHYFNLHVLTPTAFILGSEEYHTQAGNAISLVCIVENVSLGESRNLGRTFLCTAKFYVKAPVCATKSRKMNYF